MNFFQILITVLLLKLTMCKSHSNQEVGTVSNDALSDMSSANQSIVGSSNMAIIWEKSKDFSQYSKLIENAQPNDTVFIPPGFYRVNQTVQIKADHLTILGNQTTLITKIKQNIFFGDNINHLSIISISAMGVFPARTFLIKAEGGSNLNISNCTTDGMGLLGLFKSESGMVHKDLIINNSSISNAGAHGIFLQYLDGFQISNSRFINCSGDGIKTNLAPCKNGLVFKCYFESNGDDGFDLFGGGHNITLDSCEFVDQKLQLKNIGGQYYRPEVGYCTIKRSRFINSSVICLSKYIPGSEFKGLEGIKIDSNQWINRSNSCFQSNGAVNFEFTNNNIVLTESQQAMDIRPPLREGLILNNTFESKIDYLETNPKKGTYLIATKKQSDSTYGVLDEQGTLIIAGNTFIKGRRNYKLEGLANYRILNNRSIGQNDISRYQGLQKLDNSATKSKYIRESEGNVLEP